MSVIEVIFTGKFIIALFTYAVLTVICIPLFNKIHDSLEHHLLQWYWDFIGMPLLRAALMLLFIFMSYPLIFAIVDAPTLTQLLMESETRVNNLINVLFLVTLLFPIIPVIGNWIELILPAQGIVACMMVFSWLAAYSGLDNFSYWPGLDTVAYLLILALFTHWLAVKLSSLMGGLLDRKFNVLDSGSLIERAIVIFMQSPSILIFSLALGRQLH